MGKKPVEPITSKRTSAKSGPPVLRNYDRPILANTDTDWFKRQGEKRGLTQTEVALRIKKHQSIYSSIIQGKRLLKLSEAKTLAELFDQPIDVVIEKAGIVEGGLGLISAGEIKTVPVKGWVGADYEVHGELIGVSGPRTVPMPRGTPGLKDPTAALRVQTGDQGVFDGALAFMRPEDKVTPAEVVGRVAVLKVDGGKELIRLCSRAFSARNRVAEALSNKIKK